MRKIGLSLNQIIPIINGVTCLQFNFGYKKKIRKNLSYTRTWNIPLIRSPLMDFDTNPVYQIPLNLTFISNLIKFSHEFKNYSYVSIGTGIFPVAIVAATIASGNIGLIDTSGPLNEVLGRASVGSTATIGSCIALTNFGVGIKF